MRLTIEMLDAMASALTAALDVGGIVDRGVTCQEQVQFERAEVWIIEQKQKRAARLLARNATGAHHG